MLNAVDAEIGLSASTSGHRIKVGENEYAVVTGITTRTTVVLGIATTTIMVLPKHMRNCTVNSLKPYLIILLVILLFIAINIPPTNTFESRIQPLPGHSNFETVQYYVTHPPRTIQQAPYQDSPKHNQQSRFVF